MMSNPSMEANCAATPEKAVSPVLPVGSFAGLRFLIRADFYRYDGARGLKSFFRLYFTEPGARFTFWLRISAYLKSKPLWKPLFILAWLIRRHYEIKFGIALPSSLRVGPGLYISHFGGIVVNGNAVIGRNCNLGHGVTIGQSNRGKTKGCPTIGDNVFIGPGAKIFGNVKIGSHVAIGANAVVTSDIPDKAVAAGIPARIISMAGSANYVEWIDYNNA